MPYASAQESKLDGVWQSDWQLTQHHINADCKLNEELISGLRQMMGKMTIRYDGDSAVFTMPEIHFEAAGQSRLLEGWTLEAKLRFIGRTETQIALITASGEPAMDDSIMLIQFESPDLYWVYLGHLPFSDLHAREYFRRVPPDDATSRGAKRRDAVSKSVD